jgi:hypothetical protein
MRVRCLKTVSESSEMYGSSGPERTSSGTARSSYCCSRPTKHLARFSASRSVAQDPNRYFLFKAACIAAIAASRPSFATIALNFAR